MKKLPAIKRDRGYHLRVFQAKYNLDNTQAAGYFSLGASFWSLLVHGKRNASPKVAEKIAKVTGADFKELVGL